MKKIILSMMVVAVLGITSAAAQIGLGLKAGANISNQVYSDGAISPKSILGYYGGAFVNIGFGGNLSVQPELLFSTQGSKFDINDIKTKTLINYVNLPVVVQYQIFEGFRLEAGAQVGYATSGSIKEDGKKIKDWDKELDAGLVGGLSYRLPIGIGIDARYNAGLVNINEVSSPTIKNGVFAVGVHLKF